MFVCSTISASLRFSAICGETSSSVATAFATTLSRVTVGIFSSAAFFELGEYCTGCRHALIVTGHFDPSVILVLTILHVHAWRHAGLQTKGEVMSAVTQGNLIYTLSIFCA